MLNCEFCSKTFTKEGFLKRHLTICKKRGNTSDDTKQVEEVVQSDLLSDDETHVVFEQPQIIEDISSSSEEETVKKKVVTFKEPCNNDKIEKLLTSILNKYSQLNSKLNSIETKLNTAIETMSQSNSKQNENMKAYFVQHFETVNKELSNLSRSFSELCYQKTTVQVETEQQTSEVVKDDEIQKECCLILATNEDRLKRRLFKICLIENWTEQQDKVKDTYHVVMERMFEKIEDGVNVLKQIEDNFSKKRVSPNKKWYKLRDNDLDEVVELFN